MDGDDLRNWGYYDCHSLKSHGGMQILSNMPDVKPILGGRDATHMSNVNGGFNQRDYGVSNSQYPMNYMRGAWIHGENKFFDMLPNNPGYPLMPETSTAHHIPVQLLHQSESSADDRVVHLDEIVPETDSNNCPAKKRAVSKSENGPKTKKSKKGPNATKDGSNASAHRAKTAKKVTEVLINGINMDISSIPIPVCSCTSTPQQCYRWGSGGWQSACCTTGMSQYPLPMSTKRRGARIAGRKMSLGAFKKVLEKLAAEGYNFSNPIDLRTYWAKHGTNKFVTIR